MQAKDYKRQLRPQKEFEQGGVVWIGIMQIENMTNTARNN